METIEVDINTLRAAYKNASLEMKRFLEYTFGNKCISENTNNEESTNSDDKVREKNLYPFTYVLKFIELIRDSFEGADYVYTHGSCTKLAMILKYIFPEGEIYTDLNHSIFEYDGKFYDINGFAEKTKNYVPILDFGVLKAYDLMSNKFKMSNNEKADRKAKV